MKSGALVGAKKKNATPAQKEEGDGAMCGPGRRLTRIPKLCVSWLVGGRDAGWADGLYERLRQPPGALAVT